MKPPAEENSSQPAETPKASAGRKSSLAADFKEVLEEEKKEFKMIEDLIPEAKRKQFQETRLKYIRIYLCLIVGGFIVG